MADDAFFHTAGTLEADGHEYEVFDPTVLDALQRLDLSQITVENEQGAYFELGSLWLVVDRQGGRPRLVTVNRQALLEAAKAAKNRTERGLGRPL